MKCATCGSDESSAGCTTPWKHPGAVVVAFADANEIERLRARVDRFAEALREISASQSDATGMRAIARAALAGEETES